jgi:uncharacterized membrane protein
LPGISNRSRKRNRNVPHVTLGNAVPWFVLLPGVAVLAVMAWLAYASSPLPSSRRRTLIALRFLTLALIALCLLRPVRSTDDGVHDAVVPILVDGSRSMSIEDAGGRPRIDAARELVTKSLLPALTPVFTVDVLSFGDDLSATPPDDLKASGRRSDLGAALSAIKQRYRGRPIAGIVLVSDGGDTGGHAVPDALAPVYAIGVGSPSVHRDREIVSVTAAEAVFDDSRIDLAVSAVGHGDGTEPLALQLLENGKPVEVRRVAAAGEGAPVRTVFQVTPHGGEPVVYTVEVPVAPGELVPENNSRRVLVQPPSRVRHVLFVEGAPGFEHSFLKRAWAADPGLDVDSIVRKGKNERGADTFYIQASRARTGALSTGYPARVEDLFAYDALVLANVEAGQLTRDQMEMTRAFVSRRGGGLLVLGARSLVAPGLAGTPIEEVLPLQLSSRGDAVLPASSRGMNRVALTAEGESHPLMQLGTSRDEVRKRWDATPALAAAIPLGGPRPAARVLAVTGGAGGAARALVAVQRYGEGRSMVFTGEASWRWRMLLPSSDRSFDTFWRQSVRWLSVAAPDPISVVVPASGSPGDALPVRVAVRDAAFVPQTDATVELRVTAPDGRTETLSATAERREDGSGPAYVGWMKPGEPGVFRVAVEARRGAASIGTASAAVLVGGADLEMTDPRLNTPLLERIALASGGRLMRDADVPGIVDGLRAGLPAARLAATRDLWDNGWSFAAIVGLLAGEWVLRRRWGLR